MDILVNLSPWLYLDVSSFIFIFSKFLIIGVNGGDNSRDGLAGLSRFEPSYDQSIDSGEKDKLGAFSCLSLF